MKKKLKTQWHELFEGMLQELLTPVGVTVQPNFPVLSQAPKADILLMHKNSAGWTSDQKDRLPDGIRESKASHVIMEFKYTNDNAEDAFLQLLGYFFFYNRLWR